ncbi:N-acetyltransferase family protein [Fredinandcohnia humi]
MSNVEVRRPSPDDVKELHAFFRTVITDTFQKEGIGELVEDIEEEVETKVKYLASDLESGGEKRYFLIAAKKGKIIGTIEYGPASNLIAKCTDYVLKDLNEVGTVFVHPDYQGMGIGNLLLQSIYNVFHEQGIGEVCLDSGYKRAQTIWKKKFGEPDFLIENLWGEGFHHMIWRVTVNKLLK